MAYEQRQRVLADITSLRSREDELRQFKESQAMGPSKLSFFLSSLICRDIIKFNSHLVFQLITIWQFKDKKGVKNILFFLSLSTHLQERREEKLDERERMLKAKEEEVTCMKKNMYAQAEEFATK